MTFRAFLAPIDLLFLGVIFFAERAWHRRTSPLKKVILVIVSALQLITLILDGTRGAVVESLLLPLFARAGQRDRAVRAQLRIFLLLAFLLAPVFDTMVMVRAYGWTDLWRVSNVSWNLLEAQRDNNFHYAVGLVEYLRQQDDLLTYKGPLGFIEGLESTGKLWLISPIPRVFWPEKPLPTEMGDETRAWNDTDSIVGGLLRTGGMSFVIVGAIMFGLWLSFLEPLYYLPDKGDIGTVAYAFLTLATIYTARAIYPWVAMPLLLMFWIIIFGWKVVIGIRRRAIDPRFRLNLERFENQATSPLSLTPVGSPGPVPDVAD